MLGAVFVIFTEEDLAMFFRQRENAIRKAFSLALIFLVGGLPVCLQAQTELAVNQTNEEKPVVVSEREVVKPLVVSVLPLSLIHI